MNELILKIVSPDGVDKSIACESVSLWMAPDMHGKGEGSIGILKGHIDTVIALGNGPLIASQKGETIFSTKTQGGFATVLKNTVTVVTPHLIG